MKGLRLLVPGLVCLATLLIYGCGSDDGVTGTGATDDEGFKQVSAGGVTLEWKVGGADLVVKLSAATNGCRMRISSSAM